MYLRLYSIQLNDKPYLNDGKYAINHDPIIYAWNRFLTEADIYKYFHSNNAEIVEIFRKGELENQLGEFTLYEDIAYQIQKEHNCDIVMVASIQDFSLCYRYYMLECCTDDEQLTNNKEMYGGYYG